MQLTLLESDRRFLRAGEWVALSLAAHVTLVAAAVALSAGARRLPEDEREARVFFLLPPDRVEVRQYQSEILQLARPGLDLEDGKHLGLPSEGLPLRARAYGAREGGERSGARGQVAFGPVPRLPPDTVFSVLEVDQTVERYEGSAAPAYPPELQALGKEGIVRATYVVDTTGWVDTATVEVLYSDHPGFTESVRAALGEMRFRPARRGGKRVRQLVAQQFRFKIAPAPAGTMPASPS